MRVANAKDHPRIRGEHCDERFVSLDESGSSPHTRGALRICHVCRSGNRIIPAYAGSTTATAFAFRSLGDHPRIRGEHPRDDPAPGSRQGSSPHTRGAPLAVVGRVDVSGIIPAYAGSTMIQSGKQSSGADHPRIRGEHMLPHAPPYRPTGSSPHTRGAQPVTMTLGNLAGIIPAYAGSTSEVVRYRSEKRDHPRIRGEHGDREALVDVGHGSSPHTRGARSPPPQTPGREGIIPAYAGSTRRRRGGPGRSSDHPRIRGEHWAGWGTALKPAGSSPHTRGARRRRPTPQSQTRIIPAYAGSTAGGIHGRRCGGGSSPHTRGARSPPPQTPGREGIIPAYAGSTGRPQ